MFIYNKILIDLTKHLLCFLTVIAKSIPVPKTTLDGLVCLPGESGFPFRSLCPLQVFGNDLR
jgi:hypothetical protein